MYIYSLQATAGDNVAIEVTNQHQEMASEQVIDHSDKEEESYQPSQGSSEALQVSFK